MQNNHKIFLSCHGFSVLETGFSCCFAWKSLGALCFLVFKFFWVILKGAFVLWCNTKSPDHCKSFFLREHFHLHENAMRSCNSHQTARIAFWCKKNIDCKCLYPNVSMQMPCWFICLHAILFCLRTHKLRHIDLKLGNWRRGFSFAWKRKEKLF